ncbi:MAG: hypothetical protein JST79_21290 [Acidobacteria bacterium]|nr:hypothetical protein [Acidobacteriota bacterium]
MRAMRVAGLLLACYSVLAVAQEAAPPAGQQTPPPPAMRREHRAPGVAGTITAITGQTISVKTRDGQTAQVTVSDKTEYRKGRDSAKLSDLKIGDEIFVKAQKAEDGTWPAEVIGVRPPGAPSMGDFRDALGKKFILGEIKSIQGLQLTILRPDGVEQTIAVDESTSFRKDGESVTLADFKAGDHVFGRGELKNEVFVPVVLNWGEPRFMGGTGQPPK